MSNFLEWFDIITAKAQRSQRERIEKEMWLMDVLCAFNMQLAYRVRKFISQGSREEIGLFRPFPTDNAAKLFF